MALLCIYIHTYMCMRVCVCACAQSKSIFISQHTRIYHEHLSLHTDSHLTISTTHFLSLSPPPVAPLTLVTIHKPLHRSLSLVSLPFILSSVSLPLSPLFRSARGHLPSRWLRRGLSPLSGRSCPSSSSSICVSSYPSIFLHPATWPRVPLRSISVILFVFAECPVILTLRPYLPFSYSCHIIYSVLKTQCFLLIPPFPNHFQRIISASPSDLSAASQGRPRAIISLTPASGILILSFRSLASPRFLLLVPSPLWQPGTPLDAFTVHLSLTIPSSTHTHAWVFVYTYNHTVYMHIYAYRDE